MSTVKKSGKNGKKVASKNGGRTLNNGKLGGAGGGSKNSKIMFDAKGKRVMPTGSCRCGCGTETSNGVFFALGHDKRMLSKAIREKYGSILGFLASHGY